MLSLILAISATTLTAHADPVHESTAKGHSIVTRKLIGRQLRSESKAPNVVEDLERFKDVYSEINRELQAIKESDHKLQVAKDVASSVLKAKVRNPYLAKVGDLALGQLTSINKPLNDHYKRTLGTLIRTAVDQQYMAQFNGRLDQLALINIDEKYQLTKVLRDKLNECIECDQSQRDLIVRGSINALEALIKGQDADFDSLTEAYLETKTTVEETVTALARANRKLEAYGDGLNELQQAMAETQKLINADLKSLADSLAGNTQDSVEMKKELRFLREFLASDAPPKMKLLALSSGLYGQKNKDKKQVLIQNLTKLNVQVVQYMSSINELYGLANHLGIKMSPKTHKLVEKANKAAEAFNAITTGLATNNYVGVALSVAGLFSKGHDVAGERHKQIMEALSQINRKLDVVLENQAIIIKNQHQILEAIQQVSQQVHEQYLSLFKQTELTRIDIATNGIMLLESARQPLNSCKGLMSTIDEALSHPDTKYPVATLNSILSVRRHAKAFDQCSDVAETLEKIRTDESSDVFPAILSLRTNSSAVLDKKTFADIHQQVDNVRNLLITLQKKDSAFLKKVFYLGLAPHTDPVSLRLYHDQLFGDAASLATIEGNEMAKLEFAELDGRLEAYLFNPLNIGRLFEVTQLVEAMHPYLDIVNNRYEVDFSLKDLTRKPGQDLLLNTLTYLDIAIAQNSVYNGQSLVPMIYDNLEQRDVVAAAIKVFKDNEVIRNNFARYFVANRYFELTNRNMFKRILSDQGHPYISRQKQNHAYLRADLRPSDSATVKLDVDFNAKPTGALVLTAKKTAQAAEESYAIDLPVLAAGDHSLFELSSNSEQLIQRRHDIRALYESYQIDGRIESKLGREFADTWNKMTLLSSE